MSRPFSTLFRRAPNALRPAGCTGPAGPAGRPRRASAVRPLLAAALLVVLLSPLSGCEDDDVADIPPLGQASLTLELVTELEPGADQTGFADLSEVLVEWSEIRLDRQGSADVVLTPTREFDLLDHVDVPQPLFGGAFTIPAGSYRAMSWVDARFEMVDGSTGQSCTVSPVSGETQEFVIRDGSGNPDPLVAEDGGSYTLLIDTVTTRIDCTSGWVRDDNQTEVRRQ